MRLLTVQLQPGLATGFDPTLVRDLLDGLASNSSLIESVAVTEGDDNGPYVNFTVKTPDVAALWRVIRQELFSLPLAGQHLARAAIVTCQGNAGWDDYLLLHHFDMAEPLDSLDGNR